MSSAKRTKIGIIREGKTPSDARVPLIPAQCAFIEKYYPVDFLIEPSPVRCIPDEEYAAAGLTLSHDLSGCDILIGIKEVPIEKLMAGKTYCFFSHTIKKQAHNRKLLQAVLEKNIKLVDYETLTNEKGERIIAFGRFAGIVGAHNGMMAWGRRTKDFVLPQMHSFKEFKIAKEYYEDLVFPAIKICVTGTGRVAGGAVEVLNDMGIEQVSPQDFISKTYKKAVYTQLSSLDYVRRKDGQPFTAKEFYGQPRVFESAFEPYTKVTDLFINCIYWDNNSPAFFSADDMNKADFKIRVIADITCDIAPDSSVPSTLDASTIANPVFGYDPIKKNMTEPYQPHTIDVMSIDNLPSELPKDASAFFGQQFTANVLEELLGIKDLGAVKRATIAENGKLTPRYQYLADYVSGN